MAFSIFPVYVTFFLKFYYVTILVTFFTASLVFFLSFSFLASKYIFFVFVLKLDLHIISGSSRNYWAGKN